KLVTFTAGCEDIKEPGTVKETVVNCQGVRRCIAFKVITVGVFQILLLYSAVEHIEFPTTIRSHRILLEIVQNTDPYGDDFLVQQLPKSSVCSTCCSKTEVRITVYIVSQEPWTKTLSHTDPLIIYP